MFPSLQPPSHPDQLIGIDNGQRIPIGVQGPEIGASSLALLLPHRRIVWILAKPLQMRATLAARVNVFQLRTGVDTLLTRRVLPRGPAIAMAGPWLLTLFADYLGSKTQAVLMSVAPVSYLISLADVPYMNSRLDGVPIACVNTLLRT